MRSMGSGTALRAPRPGSPRLVSSWVHWWLAIGAAVAALAAAGWIAPRVPVDPITGYLIGFAAVCGSAIAAGDACPRVRRRALWLLMLPISALRILEDSGGSGLGAAAVVGAVLLAGGSLLGAIVGGEVEHAGYLVFVAVVSSAMDLVSVFHPTGPSAVIASSRRAMSLVAVSWPMLGTSHIEPYLGVGDVVFTSLYIAACRRHGLSRSRTLGALALGYAAAALAVVAYARPIPALPLLGAAVVGIHAEARRPPARDLARGVLVAALVVAACFAILVYRAR